MKKSFKDLGKKEVVEICLISLFLITILIVGIMDYKDIIFTGYETVSSTEVTVLDNNHAPVYLPKGVTIKGEAYEYVSTADGLFKKGKVQENKPIDKKILIKTASNVTISPAT